MKRKTKLGWLLTLVWATGGCSQQTVLQNPPPPTALSLAEWKQLPVSEKYDDATFERLRMNDPKLKSDRAWRAFMIKEIIPQRKQDIPTPPGSLPPDAAQG